MSQLSDKYTGCFVGLAIGDTLGMSVEFETRGSFKPRTKPAAGGPFDLPLGYWTDDTSMALCLADSLLEKHGYDSFDVMDKYYAWWHTGYRSSTGSCFDIGNQVSTAINRYKLDGRAVVDIDTKRLTSAGNGSIMRLAPVIIAAHASGQSIEAAMEFARISARETHYSREAEAGTAIFGALLYNAFDGVQKTNIFAFGQYPQNEEFSAIIRILKAAKDQTAETLKPTGYIVNSLEAAVWAFMNHDRFEQGVLAAVNLGGDADTIGAIYGQLGGAFYGHQAIPESWRSVLYEETEIIDLASRLAGLKTCSVLRTRFAEDGDLYQ
jgi:ADP-ribosyl-[dinitrogen reductase] hydrolase